MVTVRDIIERIVRDLKGDTDVLPELKQCLLLFVPAPPIMAPIRQEAAINPAVLCSTMRKYSLSETSGLPL